MQEFMIWYEQYGHYVVHLGLILMALLLKDLSDRNYKLRNKVTSIKEKLKPYKEGLLENEHQASGLLGEISQVIEEK